MFYNQDGGVIGTITEAGYFSCLTTRRTLSAQLLSAIPKEELELSPRGLYFLINDLLAENSLDILYEYLERETEKGQVKCLWLEPMIAQVICNAGYPISSPTLNAVIIHFHKDRVFSLLTRIENSLNALSFFHSIFKTQIQ